MGVLPLEMPEGETAESLGLTGHEVIDVVGLAGLGEGDPMPRRLEVRAGEVSFTATVRIDTPKEADSYRHGGLLQYVLDRKSVVSGTSVSVRVDLGGRRTLKKKKNH